jgi:hypothetical protein
MPYTPQNRGYKPFCGIVKVMDCDPPDGLQMVILPADYRRDVWGEYCRKFAYEHPANPAKLAA